MMVMMLGTKAMDAGDQSALTAFYNGLDDKGTLGWNTGTDLCGQTGIICSGDRAQRLYVLLLFFCFVLLFLLIDWGEFFDG